MTPEQTKKLRAWLQSREDQYSPPTNSEVWQACLDANPNEGGPIAKWDADGWADLIGVDSLPDGTLLYLNPASNAEQDAQIAMLRELARRSKVDVEHLIACCNDEKVPFAGDETHQLMNELSAALAATSPVDQGEKG